MELDDYTMVEAGTLWVSESDGGIKHEIFANKEKGNIMIFQSPQGSSGAYLLLEMASWDARELGRNLNQATDWLEAVLGDQIELSTIYAGHKAIEKTVKVEGGEIDYVFSPDVRLTIIMSQVIHKPAQIIIENEMTQSQAREMAGYLIKACNMVEDYALLKEKDSAIA